MAHTISALMNTSVEDCKSTLQFITDLEFLKELLAHCEKLGHTSRAKVVRSRIRQIERNSK